MSRVWTTACINHAGTVPEARQQLIITWMLRPIISKVSFMIWEGTTSRGEVEDFMCRTSFPSSDKEIDLN